MKYTHSRHDNLREAWVSIKVHPVGDFLREKIREIRPQKKTRSWEATTATRRLNRCWIWWPLLSRSVTQTGQTHLSIPYIPSHFSDIRGWCIMKLNNLPYFLIEMKNENWVVHMWVFLFSKKKKLIFKHFTGAFLQVLDLLFLKSAFLLNIL